MARERRESYLAELSLWQPSCLAHSAKRVRRLSSRQVGPPSLWICQYPFRLPMVAMLSRRLGATGLKLPSSPCCGVSWLNPLRVAPALPPRSCAVGAFPGDTVDLLRAFYHLSPPLERLLSHESAMSILTRTGERADRSRLLGLLEGLFAAPS